MTYWFHPYWIPIDAHVSCLIQREIETKRQISWRLWEGDKLLWSGSHENTNGAEYAAWSWYVDWCAKHCPIRLEYL